jgi:hypothetical protein
MTRRLEPSPDYWKQYYYGSKHEEILARQRARGKKYRDSQRGKQLKKTRSRRTGLAIYNLTTEAYNAKLKKQKNLCAVCELPFKKTPHIDHDHKTGQVRDLLCNDCNTALGLVHENLKTALGLIEYIVKWKP